MQDKNNFLMYARNKEYQNAGYIRLFAPDRLWTNPIIDVAVKHKWVREHTGKKLFNELQTAVYAGATVFNNSRILKEDDILHMDLKSAYPAYMVSQFKKPGNRREKFDYFVSHHPEKINLYEIEFRVHNDNMFVKWFINEVAYKRKQVVREEEFTSGIVRFFSSGDMNMSDYVAKMLEDEEYRVVSTTQFDIKDNFVDKFVDVPNLIDLYQDKENNWDTFNLQDKYAYKSMLNSSSGWLQRVDRPVYYHMVQTVKFVIMKMILDNDLYDTLASVMTDGVYIRVIGENKERIDKLLANLDLYKIKHGKSDMKGKLYSLGTWKHEMLKGDDLLVKIRQTLVKKVN